MHSITCIGKDNVMRRFVFDDPAEEILPDGSLQLGFCVKTRYEASTFFELRLCKKPDGQFQIISVNHHNQAEYASMGIPDSLLPFLARLLGDRICSSRSYVGGTNEYRTVEATKMWERLVQKGLAEYYAEEDVYRITEP